MNLHSPLSFNEKSFKETALSAEPAPPVGSAFLSLESGKAFFMTGAGASAGQPTKLPTGPQLADILEKWARPGGHGETIDALEDKTDLGQICEMLEQAVGRPTLVREIRESVDWRDSAYNLCHLAIALFYGEQILSVSFTANWDPKLEDAFGAVNSKHRPQVVWSKGMMAVVGNDPYLVHLHGHWSDPDSLVMTNTELSEPRVLKWTDPNLKAALSNRDPIFVGFAAEPEYVIRSLEEMREEMKRPPASVIGLESVEDFCDKSASLSKALGLTDNKDPYIQGDACELMGELLRCCYRKHIGLVVADAVEMVAATEASGRIVDPQAEPRLRAAIESMPLEGLLGLLWSATARATEAGICPQRTIASCATNLAEALAVVMVLSSCADVNRLTISRSGFRIHTEEGSAVDLWPAMPSEHINPALAQSRAYQHSDRFSGPADAKVPLVLVCAGTVGALPKSPKVSLVGKADSTSVRSPQRSAADLITFDELDRRLSESEDGPVKLAQVLRL